VELSVKLVQRWILARLRHRQFFSLAELNAAIRELLDDLNRRVIKYLGKSRYELYRELDRPALKPLPQRPYIYRAFKECKVSIDYHIQLEKAFYSVPYQLAGRVVTARYSETTVEIYHENARVAVHRRLSTVRAGTPPIKSTWHLPTGPMPSGPLHESSAGARAMALIRVR